MDIYCVRCGEPWDMDELHYRAEEIDSTFARVRDEFYGLGCEAMGAARCEREDTLTVVHGGGSQTARLSDGAAMSVLVDLLGDDIDGIASMMEDYRAGY